MAAAPPLPTPFRIPLAKSLKPSSSSSNEPFPSYKLCCSCRCEAKNFDHTQNWTTVDRFPAPDPIRIFQAPPSSLTASPMQMAASARESSGKSSRKVCLFYCSETKPLAERVAAQSDAIELRSINWRYAFSMSNEQLN